LVRDESMAVEVQAGSNLPVPSVLKQLDLNIVEIQLTLKWLRGIKSCNSKKYQRQVNLFWKNRCIRGHWTVDACDEGLGSVNLADTW
jgi:hypothetical protein